jgi:Protein of unknown function (DUF3352)
MPTMRMRLRAAAPLVALALLAAGCGSSKSNETASGGPSGAEVIPASATAYISVNTDLGSAQWKQVDALSKKFPGRAKVIAEAEKQMSKDGVDFKQDVKPALGPEIDFAWLDFADNGVNVVAVTQPKDEAKFAALVAKGNKSDPKSKLFTEKIGDWTALSDSQAKLDRLKSAQNGAKLADQQGFKDAVADLPGDALVKAYANGQAARTAIKSSLPPSATTNGVLAGTPLENLDWISAAGTAESSGIRIVAGAKGAGDRKTYSSELVKQLPAGAWAYLSFNDLASSLRGALKSLNTSIPGFQAKRAQLEQAFGFSLEQDLLPLFAGEGAVSVYPGATGSRIPTIDFVLKVNDESKARRVLQRLTALARLGNVGAVRTVKVGGVTATELRLGGGSTSIYYGVSKGLVMVTTSRSALAAVGRSGKKLADDPLFKEVRSGAKAPDKTTGFLYVNLHASLPAIYNFVASSGASASLAEARANTARLQSAFIYGTEDGDVTRVGGFVEVK